MFDTVEVEYSFRNLCSSQGENNRAIVEGVGVVNFLRNNLNKCELPIRINVGTKNEVKRQQNTRANSSANRRTRSIGTAERRISRKVRAKESGFITRRTN